MNRIAAASLLLLLCASVLASNGSPYDADVGIIEQAIVLRADFERQILEVSVLLSLQNFSSAPVSSIDLQLCVPGDYSDLAAEVRPSSDPQVTISTRTAVSPHNSTKQWVLHNLAFDSPLAAGETRKTEIVYSIKKKGPESEFPFYRDKKDARELYLLIDMNWLPAVFVAVKPGQFPNLPDSSWRLELQYPDGQGLVAAVDGRLANRSRSRGWVREQYRSWFPGSPQVFVAPYDVTRARQGSLAIEIYSPAGDAELLANARSISPEVMKIFAGLTRLYTPLPDNCVYRLVVSHASNGGHGMAAGQVVSRFFLKSRNMRTIAHEMGHTWWGGLVASYGQGSKFLREAMAEFTSAWAMGELYGPNAFQNVLLQGKLKGLCYYPAQYDVTPQSPLVEQDGYSSQSVIIANYNRGATAVNAIRLELGDKLFYRALREFLTEYRAKRVDIRHFTRTVSRVSGHDFEPRIKEICWTVGFPTYRLVNLQSRPVASGYQTALVIKNDGNIQASCPVLLKTSIGEQLEIFQVPARQESTLSFHTREQITEAIIDPDGTALHFDPQKKLELWSRLDSAYLERENWLWFNKSYALNGIGKSEEAIATISSYLDEELRLQNKADMNQLGEDPLQSAYLFGRASFHLDAGHGTEAERDLRACLSGMAQSLLNPRAAGIFVRIGAVPEKEPVRRVAELLRQATGHPVALTDDPAGLEAAVQEWLAWWRAEGKMQPVRVEVLRKSTWPAGRRAGNPGGSGERVACSPD